MISFPNNDSFNFLVGGGEMGDLIRAKDWSQTPLGEPANWPSNLKTTLSLLLNSRFPMFLFWGPDLVCFYNNDYRPSLGETGKGKHPGLLGMRGEDGWPEIWSTIKPLIDQVMQTGVATWSEDQLIPIFRNNAVEDVYWTFSYSPVYTDQGKPVGVFVTCTETTDKVRSLQQMRDLTASLEQKVAERTQELASMNDQLGKSNRDLEQFAYVSSHDLQEPLRKIQTFVDLAQTRAKDEQERSVYLEKVTLAAGRMQELIRAVLNYSRVGNVAQAFVAVDLNQVIEDIKRDFELLIEERNAQIIGNTLPTVPGIPLQLHQLFANLFSNALKFSTESPIITIRSAMLTPDEQATLPHYNRSNATTGCPFKTMVLALPPNLPNRSLRFLSGYTTAKPTAVRVLVWPCAAKSPTIITALLRPQVGRGKVPVSM